MESKLKMIFESSLDHVSTTADIWSANNKSYLGMTVHWIDSITLKLEKAAPSCLQEGERKTHLRCHSLRNRSGSFSLWTK